MNDLNIFRAKFQEKKEKELNCIVAWFLSHIAEGVKLKFFDSKVLKMLANNTA